MIQQRRRQVLPLLLLALMLTSLLYLTRREDVQAQKVAAGSRSTGSGLSLIAAASQSKSPTGSPAAPNASATNAPALFQFVQPANAAFLSASIGVPALSINFIRLDREAINGKASPFWQAPGEGRVSLPLAGGGSITVAIDSSSQLGPNRFTSVGRVEGHELSQATFAYNEGYLTASIVDPEGSNYEIRAASGDIHALIEADPNAPAVCGGGIEPSINGAVLDELARRQAADSISGNSASLQPVTLQASTGAGVEIQLMMLFTQAVAPTYMGTARMNVMQSVCDAAVAQLNSSLAKSQIEARVRLVRIAEVNYDGDQLSGSVANWESDMLGALRLKGDGKMDEIQAMRDEAGADLVCLIHARHDTLSAGIGYVPSVDTGIARLLNSEYGFSVVDSSFMLSYQVVSHEIGHNLGCAHDRAASAGSGGVYSYSYGYIYQSGGVSYRDIMGTGSGTRLTYFSNPNIIPPETPGLPIGVPVGQPEEADCALSIDNFSFAASAYRLQAQSDHAAGTLYAVATRAYVGSRPEEQLIGGLIINGTEPKQILVKGIGPGLSGSVANYLADPFLSLYRLESTGNTLVATNDNWGTESNAAAIALAGGTPISAGSRDAAMLLTVPPGAYSVNVTSANGSTGDALVEVYETGATANRIVGLATRGYANKGREMFAGFIVSGAGGTTKRIVIRAQGPSLGQAPYNIPGAMNDPLLELHNSKGDLIMINDDWTVTSTGGDDFKPMVQYYSEQQIFDAGMAPGNRREPCIMVDLPPGLYTAILKPFEDLTSNPAQVAQPGIAIVEVYEVP